MLAPCCMTTSVAMNIRRPGFLHLCHVRDVGFVRAQDEAIVGWISKLTEASHSEVAVSSVSMLSSAVSCPPVLLSLEMCNADVVPGQRSLSGDEMVRIRLGVIRAINALVNRCVYVVDPSLGRLHSSLASLLKRRSYLLFRGTKVCPIWSYFFPVADLGAGWFRRPHA